MDHPSKVSTQLISHLSQFRDGEWNPQVRRRTELCLLDSLACYSAGLSLKNFSPTATVASNLFPSSSDSPFAAAYLYGQAANMLDYDDTLYLSHPGSPIIGAVLSVGARERLSTDRLLRGIAAGYEANWFLTTGAAPSRERAAQVRSVGVWDTVSASVGVSVALGHDDELLERVIGVAVAHSMIPYTAKWYERPVPAMKNNLGWAAAGAVLSVDLALAGQTGVTNALEGDTGMWRMAGSDRWNSDPSRLTRPGVLRTGFKLFPVCWHLQGFLKTLSELLVSVAAAEDEVVSVTLAAPRDIDRFCQWDIHAPADIAFSLPATFSLLISHVEPGPQWAAVSPEDDRLRYRKIFRHEVSENRALTLKTRRGDVLHAAIEPPDYFNPDGLGLDEEGVLAKHERLTAAALRDGAIDALASCRSCAVPNRLYTALASRA
ncbi:hypothetical protein BDV24DRAFT_163235 [Aspergillus arachidicola]|uniref:MmgE/PrpD N-terminal domain-containing protein n=1 Tax=Aspergillus arachidicola TaxID=656916 RepID=A0A5N6Y879_9EURO|nr:hypothetical protein BDV24DRAFT_163235 [Aspergillus arachidicola]